MSDNLATISAVYEAFGKGDIPTILNHLSDDVRWEDSMVSVVHRQRGSAGIFNDAASFQIKEFRVLSLMAGGNQVAAEIVTEADVPGGGHYRDEEIYLWTFDDNGKIVRMRHYTDTAKHIAAAQGQR